MKQKKSSKLQVSSCKNKGFTLVEVLVSVGLFVMIIVAISQIYIAVLRSEQTAYALLNSENNIRDNLEFMARSIRMGRNFNLSEDGKMLSFDYYSEGAWQNAEYRFNNSTKNLDKNSFPLFDSSVLEITDGRFYLKDSGRDSQKTIIIVLEATTRIKQKEYIFNVETSVTPRILMGRGS
ncbi:MAG: prepilin-type N-terminal cleavage/methylation domain-containing protein [Candidatus Pacebacteria bacterium]|nr:prepilin-type N-terminal cleavage/methylation domain-containing protein [Candidatus Paceibacterota bacterium]